MQTSTVEDLLLRRDRDLCDARHRDPELLRQTLDEETSSDAEPGRVTRDVMNVGAA